MLDRCYLLSGPESNNNQLTNMANVIIAESKDQIALELITVIKNAIDNVENPVIGLSGGSLPNFLVAGIQSDQGKTIDWSKAKFIFCDERMVPQEDPASKFFSYIWSFQTLTKVCNI